MATTVYSQSVSLIGSGVSFNYIINAQGSQGSLAQIIQAIDNTFGVLFTTPPNIPSSKVNVYDGTTNFCVDVQYPVGSLNTVLAYIGTKVCALYTSKNGGGDVILADPLGTQSLPVNTPGYVYPSLPVVPTLFPVSGYVYPPTAGILNYNPVDTTIAGHLKGIIAALNFADNYANVRPDYNFLKGTLSYFPDSVKTPVSVSTTGLSANLGNGDYFLSGLRLAISATSATSVGLTAFSDNYVDVTAIGTYINNFVPNGNAAPAIAANTIRLFKFVTNAGIVTSTTTFYGNYGLSNSYFQSQSVDGRVIANKSIGPLQLADTAVVPGTYGAPSFTVDQQGRIITILPGSFTIASPANKDILQYSTISNTFVNVPVIGSVLPLGNDGDVLRFNGISGQWESSSLVNRVFTQYNVSFENWQPNASATASITVGPFPAAFIPVSYKIRLRQSFAGGAITAATVRLKDSLGNIYTPSPFNVFQAPGDNVGIFSSNLSAPSIPSQSSPSDMDLELQLTGGTMNDLTQGSVDVWISYIVLS